MPEVAIWSIADFGAGSLFNLISGTFTITPGATPDVAEFSDDDLSFDDFFGNGGQVQDPGLNQTLTQNLMIDGVTVATVGDEIYNAAEGQIVNNTTGETGRILFITINGGSAGDFIGVATTIEINPGDNVTTSNLDPVATENYTNVVTCFTTGCTLKTGKGGVAVEKLKVGDKLWTKDAGYQSIRWIGQKSITKDMLEENPNMFPIRIKKNALGPNKPSRDISVSRQHRILISSHVAEMLFGAPDVLVPAIGLTDLPGVYEDTEVETVEYWHVLLSDHQIIKCDGMETESYLPSIDGVFSQSQAELLSIFPQLMAKPLSFGSTREPTLSANETRILTTFMLEIDRHAFEHRPNSSKPLHVL